MGKLLIICIPLMILGCSALRKDHSNSKSSGPKKRLDCHINISHEMSALKKDSNEEQSKSKIFNRLGNCLGEAGYFGESYYYYEIALSFKDLTSAARSAIYSNMANNFLATGNIELGLTTLEQALKLNPENQSALVKIGFCYFQIADFQNSKRYLLNVKKPTKTVLFYLAANYFFMEDPRQLSNVLGKITDKNNDSFRLLEKAQQILQAGANSKMSSETQSLVIENYALKMVKNHIYKNYEKNGLPH